MLRTGEDWDSQQHGNARSVIEIDTHEIFDRRLDPQVRPKLEAHVGCSYCVKFIKLFERSVKMESHRVDVYNFGLWFQNQVGLFFFNFYFNARYSFFVNFNFDTTLLNFYRFIVSLNFIKVDFRVSLL